MDIAQLIARAWVSPIVDQYARKQSFSPLLFGDDGNAKWDESAHPRVAKGSSEAHGGQFTKKESGGIQMPAKPTNEEAKPGDQMGLFGEADRAKKPAFKPMIAGKPKQQSLFDTKGHKDQMLMFDDGVTPEDRLLKPGEVKPKIEGEDWDTVGNGVTSEDIKAKVPGLAVDPFSIRGTHVLREDEVFHPKEINNRRIAARARRQKIERERAGLFAGEVAAEQKDPKAELEDINNRLKDRVDKHDNRERDKWMENLHRLAKKPPQEQAKLVAAWNAAESPKDHAYFSGWLTKAEKTGLAEKVTDRSSIKDPEMRAKAEKLDKTWRTLKDIEQSANPESSFNIAGQRLKEEAAKFKELGIEPPSYKSDKPTWAELQAEKQRKKEEAEAAANVEKERKKKELLFSPDEIAPAVGLPFKPTILGQEKQGPKDGDVDANGLVFRNGRWHREDSEAKPAEPASSTAPIPLRERAAFADNLAKQGKSEQEIEEAMRTRSIAISDAKRHAARAFAAHGAKPSEPEAVVPEEPKEPPKPAPKPLPIVEPPETPQEKASEAIEQAESAGKTVREVATAAQKQLDADYEFARASTVRNAGEDLKGSARHKVNQWRGLAEAEKDGTAAEMMTRKGLAKVEPHNLMATISDTHAMSHLVAHGALSGFPDSPGSYPSHYSAYKDRWGNPLAEPKSPEELRKQYHAAYMAIKTTAEKLATTEVDARKVSRGIADEIKKQIFICRGLAPDASGMALTEAKDPYNPVANGLVSLHNRAAGSGRKKTDLMNRVLEVAKHAQEKYGAAPSRDHLAMIKEHALDLMEGKSMNKTFGLESKAVKRFDPSEAYVKHATRKGGRDVAGVTSDANKATKHMVETMGLRGVQWGNSVSDDERKHHAAKAVEALTDLADITGLHPKDIALDGKLGLAIGARGKGNASAHYEPGTKVINLTRASGVGALAHEWGHAFDHMLNDYTTNKDFNYMSNNYDRGTDKAEIRAAYKKWWKDSEKYRTRLRGYLQDQMREGGMSAKKANEYWNSSHEIFARTFERHVQHKLESSDKKNTYLAGLGGDHPLWPSSEESASMAESFDGILSAYRKHKYGSTEKVKFSAREAMEALAPQVTRYRFKPLILAQ